MDSQPRVEGLGAGPWDRQPRFASGSPCVGKVGTCVRGWSLMGSLVQ